MCSLASTPLALQLLRYQSSSSVCEKKLCDVVANHHHHNQQQAIETVRTPLHVGCDRLRQSTTFTALCSSSMFLFRCLCSGDSAADGFDPHAIQYSRFVDRCHCYNQFFLDIDIVLRVSQTQMRRTLANPNPPSSLQFVHCPREYVHFPYIFST